MSDTIDGELLDTAECSAYPNRGRCTHTRCLLRERNRLSATVAALTAENAQLRETLTLGLGEQESVIAGLRAENERLKAALERIAAPGFPSASDAMLQSKIARAALPSSRETTDGRTDPS